VTTGQLIVVAAAIFAAAFVQMLAGSALHCWRCR